MACICAPLEFSSSKYSVTATWWFGLFKESGNSSTRKNDVLTLEAMSGPRPCNPNWGLVTKNTSRWVPRYFKFICPSTLHTANTCQVAFNLRNNKSFLPVSLMFFVHSKHFYYYIIKESLFTGSLGYVALPTHWNCKPIVCFQSIPRDSNH